MDMISEIWPEWSVEELLGTGSFGKVYKVYKEKMGYVSYAAVKVIQIPQEMAEIKNLMTSGMDHSSIHIYYKDLIKDLMSEIRVMESLKTANNIVAIEDYEVVEKSDGFEWTILIRMELLQNLSDYLGHHLMTEKDVMQLGIDICNALESCEKRHIIHRDIKIDNVFINRFGTYKLGDFGIAKQLEKTSSAMSQKGTNMYMAPEIYRGETYGNTVDIYSLGIMLYRLLNAGRFPFMPLVPQPLRYDDTEKAMQRRLSGEAVPEISGISKKFFKIVQKACAFDAAERFSSAAEMGHELSQLMTESVSDIANEAIHDEGKREILKDTYEDDRTVAAFASEQSFNDLDDSKYRLAGQKIVQDTIEEEKKKENSNSERISSNVYETKVKVEEDFGATSSNMEKEVQKRPVSMKWYKYQIWFSLPVSAVCYLYCGLRFWWDFRFFSLEDMDDILLVKSFRSIIYILGAICIFCFWRQMKKFYQKSWKRILIIQGTVDVVIFLVSEMLRLRIAVLFFTNVPIVVLFSTDVLYISLNFLYYKKRDYLFVNTNI